MFLHGILAITATALITVAGAGALLPAKRLEVPQPNPIPTITESIPDFQIHDFEAQAVVLSNRNYISFHITPYPGANPAHCFALGTTVSHALTSVPQTWCYPDTKDAAAATSSPRDPADAFPASDHVWFAWTMGADVDPAADPTADGVFGMDRREGAYLKVVRQVDGHTRDEAVRHVRPQFLPVVSGAGDDGEGMLAHQVFAGPANFSLVTLRLVGVQH